MLGLVSCTCRGADLLNELGWETVRHKRTDRWPVQDDPAAEPPPQSSSSVLTASHSGVSLVGSLASDGKFLGTPCMRVFYDIPSLQHTSSNLR